MNQTELQRFIRRWLALSSLVAIVVGYWFTNKDLGFLGAGKDFLLGALPSAAVVVVVYLITRQWLARRGLSETDDLELAIVRRVSSLITKTPGILQITYKVDDDAWRDLFDQCDRDIVIVGRFFDVPVQSVGLGSLAKYFERGGQIKVFTLDPYENKSIQIAQEQWNYAVNQRQMVPAHYASRINTGVTMLENARIMAKKSPSVLKIFTLPAINYAAYSFDGSRLIIIPYAHANSFDDPPPRFHLDIESVEMLAGFWQNEVNSLSKDLDPLTAEQFLRIGVSK